MTACVADVWYRYHPTAISGTTHPLRAVPTHRYDGTIGAIFSHESFDILPHNIFWPEIISEFGFTVKIDENIFNFDSSKKICVYFHSGTHVLTFYKKGRTDLSVVRTLNVMAQNYNSKFVDKRITYNLDALIDERETH